MELPEWIYDKARIAHLDALAQGALAPQAIRETIDAVRGDIIREAMKLPATTKIKSRQ